jgi:hypothetical protein
MLACGRPVVATNFACAKSIAKTMDGVFKLRALVRAKDYLVEAVKAGNDEKDGMQVGFWRLKLSHEWTLPVVELSRGESKGTTILLADQGRNSVAAEAERLVAAGQRVLAVDLFSFGESKIAGEQDNSPFALLVAAVGERPLGLQASQLSRRLPRQQGQADQTRERRLPALPGKRQLP